MRFSAVGPALIAVTALVLTFIALFAGSKTSFMPGYAMINVNTSQIGAGLSNIGDMNDVTGSYASRLGLHDFYSVHVLSYCEGYYSPAALPNTTTRPGNLQMDYTRCITNTAGFDLRNILQQELNQAGHSNIQVSDLNWSSQIDDGLRTLQGVQKALVAVYSIAIVFLFIAIATATVSVCLSGRLVASFNILISVLAFLAIGIASAIALVVSYKGCDAINKYGKQVGISADPSGGFIGLTWAATGAMVINICWTAFYCARNRKFTMERSYAGKPKY